MKERPIYMFRIAVLWGLGSVLSPWYFHLQSVMIDQSLTRSVSEALLQIAVPPGDGCVD